MPRFYFDIHDDDITVDQEGIEFADAHGAIAFAYRAAREIGVESASNGCLAAEHRIDILDAGRQTIDSVTYGEAVGIER